MSLEARLGYIQTRVARANLLARGAAQAVAENEYWTPPGQTISPSGIASGQALGSPTLTAHLAPTGIASAEALGTPSLKFNQTVSVTLGVDTAMAVGTPSLTSGATVVPTAGIPSEEAFTAPRLVATITVTSIASAEAFGTPRLGAVVAPSGIASAEAVGTPSLQATATITVTSIASDEAFGTPELDSTGVDTIHPTGIPSEEAFGSPSTDVWTFSATPTSGTYTVTDPSANSVDIPFDATVDQIATAVASLPDVGPGVVTVTGAAGSELTLSWRFARIPLTLNDSGLVGATITTAVVAPVGTTLTSSVLTGDLRAAWASAEHVGANRPTQRVAVRRGRFNRRNTAWPGDPIGVYIPGLTDGKGDVNPWQAFWEPQEAYTDLANVSDVVLSKSFDGNGIGSATVTAENIIYAPQDGGGHAIKRGYMSPLRGYVAAGRTALVDQQGNTVGENEWFDRVRGRTQITIWEGYGEHQVKVFTGLVDDVDISSAPDQMVITARDFGAVLADSRVFGWNKEPDIKDPVVFIGRNAADDVTNVGSSATASSEADGFPATNVTDGNGDTDWKSVEHTTSANTEWVEIRLPEGRYSTYRLTTDVPGMELWVSFQPKTLADGSAPTQDGVTITANEWVDGGGGDIPGDNGGIPFIVHDDAISSGSFVRNLGSEFIVGDDSILRVSFRKLPPNGNGFFQASVTSLLGIRRKRTADAITQHWVLVDDAADVVRQILRWAGFGHEAGGWFVESVGAELSKRFVVNRGMTYLDVITRMAQALGYIFYMGDPTEDDSSIGVPVFRHARTVTAADPVVTITDSQLLTAIKVHDTYEPLAYIIRVRGRQTVDGGGGGVGVTLGGDTSARVMFTYRPPWSGTVGSAEWEMNGGVIRHVIHTDDLFASVDDCKFGAYFIALQEALAALTAVAEAPALPGLDLDDHVELRDLGTGITTRLWVTNRDITFHAGEQTKYVMSLGGALVDTENITAVVNTINSASRS